MVWGGRAHHCRISGLLEQGHGADCLQPPLRSGFRQRLTGSVRAPSEAWRFLQGARPCGGKVLPTTPPACGICAGGEAAQHR